MDSAFGFIRAAPPPRARPLTDLHRRRTGHATDRRIALVVKWVIGHIVLCDVVPDIPRRPCGKRVDLDEAVLLISLHNSYARALRRLIAANSRHPGTQSTEHLPERFDFTQLATEIRLSFPQTLAVFDSLIAKRKPRRTSFKADAVAHLKLIPQSVSLREEQVGIEIEDSRISTNV